MKTWETFKQTHKITNNWALPRLKAAKNYFNIVKELDDLNTWAHNNMSLYLSNQGEIDAKMEYLLAESDIANKVWGNMENEYPTYQETKKQNEIEYYNSRGYNY